MAQDRYLRETIRYKELFQEAKRGRDGIIYELPQCLRYVGK